jgi:hypothetical protein
MAKTRLAELSKLKEDIKNKEDINDYSDLAPQLVEPEEKVIELSSYTKPAKKKGRPKIGEVLPEEPSTLDIVNAAQNEPSKVFVFTLCGRDYPITDLGFLQSKAYLESLIPQIEGSMKDLAPIIYAIGKFVFLIRNLTADNTEVLRIAAQEEESGVEVLQEIFRNWGFPISVSTAEELKASAIDPMTFNNKLNILFMAPLRESLSLVSISGLILDAVNLLPDLVMASFVGSSVRRGIKPDIEKLREEVMDNMDVFDMYNVASAQIEHYKASGKIAGFSNLTSSMVGMVSQASGMLGA